MNGYFFIADDWCRCSFVLCQFLFCPYFVSIPFCNVSGTTAHATSETLHSYTPGQKGKVEGKVGVAIPC